MGCFNVAGGLTKISIGYGDRVVFLPLIPKWFKGNYHFKKELKATIEPGNLICDNGGSSALYEPRFLPIRGEYNDYGCVENIDRDENVEYMEEYFGLSIEVIIDGIRDFRKDRYNLIECKTERLTEELRHMSGMFELEEVFDTVTSERKGTAWKNFSFSTYGLHLLGFKLDLTRETGDNKKKNFYHLPDNDRLVIHASDYDDNDFIVDGEKATQYVYGLDELQEIGNKIGYEVPKSINDYSAYEFKLNEYDYSLKMLADELRIELKQKSDEASGGYLKDVGDSTEDFNELHSMLLNFRSKSISERLLYGISDDMSYCLDNKELHKSFEDLMVFKGFLTGTNNLLMPTSSGYQHGSTSMTKRLLEISQDFIEKRIKEESEY